MQVTPRVEARIGSQCAADNVAREVDEAHFHRETIYVATGNARQAPLERIAVVGMARRYQRPATAIGQTPAGQTLPCAVDMDQAADLVGLKEHQIDLIQRLGQIH